MNDEIVTVWVVQTCPKCGTDDVYYEALVALNDPSHVSTYGGYFCKDCRSFDEYAEAFHITSSELRPGMVFKYGHLGDWCVVKSVTFTERTNGLGYRVIEMSIEHVDGHVTTRHDPDRMVFLQVDERFFTNAGNEWREHLRNPAGINPHYKVMSFCFDEDRALKALKEVAL